MFGLGWEEFFILIIIAVIFIGPKELPAVVRSLSKFLRELKSARDQWTKAVRDDPGLREIERSVTEMKDSIDRPLNSIREQVQREIQKIEEETETLRREASSEATLGDVLDDKTEIYIRNKKEPK